MPEWSKGYDSSSYGESLVGSNPTQYNYSKKITIIVYLYIYIYQIISVFYSFFINYLILLLCLTIGGGSNLGLLGGGLAFP